MVKRGRPGALLLAVAIAATLSFGTLAPAGAAKKPPTLTVLVTNDDGVAAPGIDAVVEALRNEKKTKVVVVAPASNQTGAGGKYTPGGVTGGPATTASGYRATAVQGFPADAVDFALDDLELEPHVVISGTNYGQNPGPITEVSGTVGAARQAARRGIPALAISTMGGDAPDFSTSARVAVEWLRENRKALAKRKASTSPLAEIESINVPNCPGGNIRGLYETVLAPDNRVDLLSVTPDCASTLAAPTSDAEAINHGFASITKVPVPAERG
jgi:5'-nucleotidase